MSKTVICVALQSITSTIPSVGSRVRGERFQCPDYIAQHLRDFKPPQVAVEEQRPPKPMEPSAAGVKAPPASSLLVDQASLKKTSTTSRRHTQKTGAKSSR